MSKKKRKPKAKQFSIRTQSSHLSRRGEEANSAKKKSKRKKKRGKKKKSARGSRDKGIASRRLADIYSGGRPKPGSAKVESTEISFSSGEFVPNPAFESGNTNSVQYEFYFQPLEIQGLNGEEIHLSIGMDVGTSCTKVVIGDIDSNRFYAVPFKAHAEDAYLFPTEVEQAGSIIYPISQGQEAETHRNLKLDLIDAPDSINYRIRMVAYIAYVIRHSISWFLQIYGDYIGEREVLWTLNIGIPAGKGEQTSLGKLFLTLSTAAGQAAISGEDYFEVQDLKSWLQEASRDFSRVARGGDSEFAFLPTDNTIVAAIPEVAAQMYGIKKSNKWSDKRPITFLMDVGAGTVDAGVFSIMPSADRSDHDIAFNLFSANVSSTGVKRLHISRVSWLSKSLPENMPFKKRILGYLETIESVSIAGVGLPASIRAYINTLHVPERYRNPDVTYQEQMGKDIHQFVLRRAQSENPNDRTWLKLRTIISGGGSASEYYREFVNSMSSPTLRLSLVEMELPKNLNAPGITSRDYHRLSVAYGLAHYDQWKFRWPRDFKPIPRQRQRQRAASVRYVGKNDV